MSNYSKNPKRKRTLAIVLAIVGALVIMGVAGVMIGVFSNKTQNISPSFARGAINDSGEYVESDVTLYTKNSFECRGLKVALDYDATGEYQIFWYNEDNFYLSCEARTNDAFTGATPELAKYARIVYYPILEEGEEKISFIDIYNFSKKLNISVDRYQEFKPEDLYATAKLNATSDVEVAKSAGVASSYAFIKNAKMVGTNEGGQILTAFDDSLTATELDGYNVVKINCSDVSKFILRFEKLCEGEIYHAYYYNSDGVAIKQAVEIQAVEGSDVVITVPEGADFVCFNVYPGDLDEGGKEIPIVINEYLPR